MQGYAGRQLSCRHRHRPCYRQNGRSTRAAAQLGKAATQRSEPDRKRPSIQVPPDLCFISAFWSSLHMRRLAAGFCDGLGRLPTRSSSLPISGLNALEWKRSRTKRLSPASVEPGGSTLASVTNSSREERSKKPISSQTPPGLLQKAPSQIPTFPSPCRAVSRPTSIQPG